MTKGKATSDYHPIVACFSENSFWLDQTHDPIKRRDQASKAIEQALLERYHINRYEMLFHLGFMDQTDFLSDSMQFLHEISKGFIKRLSMTPNIEMTREQTAIHPLEDELVEMHKIVPFVIGVEHVNAKWLQAIYKALSQVFTDHIKVYEGTVADYLLHLNQNIHIVGNVFFHLVENTSRTFPFAFLATYSTGAGSDKKTSHVPLKHALKEFEGQYDRLLKLLSSVSQAAAKSTFVSEMVENGELFSPLQLKSQEAYTFLKEVPLYESCGILCRIPDWWKRKKNPAQLVIKMGDEEPSLVGMSALLSFDVQVHFDGEVLTDEMIKEMLEATSGLSFIKGKWVEVDQEKLRQTLQAYEQAKTLLGRGSYTLAEALRLQLQSHDFLGVTEEDVEVEVTHGQWLKRVSAQLSKPEKIESKPLSDAFKATLRPYQHQGYDWLTLMTELGFGACLADDMGLGKTVQVIALLEHYRLKVSKPSLLVIPASLIGNWQREIDRFAPHLKVKVMHKEDTRDTLTSDPTDLYMVTYGMVSRLEAIQATQWQLLILDEAQAIKNPNTKQTKAVKQVQAVSRIALTGTPIENSLSDLWSLFDFLNQGLLGTKSEFKKFTNRLKNHHGDYAKLRNVVNPFILRRLKTDQHVISDLPDKIEMKAFTTLSKKQVALYGQLVDELSQKLNDASGIGRKGLILSSIMKFKQICNHPDQYLGQPAYDHKHSGKFERLREICETIYEKRERVLVFTQFKEMTEPLAAFLEGIFGRRGLVLHGSTPVKKRASLVEAFCGETYVPYMVLSLKAGGVGLNLTAANHVIHFDRWWNPAVEDQATDRAFRIGQEKNVMVHKLITRGTIEEKIDQMIERKKELSGEIIAASGEHWLTEMDNQDLITLFSLQLEGDL